MAKETDEQGGEALIIAHGELLTIPESQIRAAFSRARDEEYQVLGDEIRAQLAMADSQELLSSLRKFEKRLGAIRAIDFFPSGKGEALQRMLEEAHSKTGSSLPSLKPLDPLQYQGKTWVTRTNPYVDRLASFWLIRRFIDPAAKIRLLAPSEPVPSAPAHILFDMAEADFTHVEGLITFEVIAESFRFADRVPARMCQVLKSIDLEELDVAPAEACGVKQMLDGLVAANPDDSARIEQALIFFDTLLASYSNTKEGNSK